MTPVNLADILRSLEEIERCVHGADDDLDADHRKARLFDILDEVRNVRSIVRTPPCERDATGAASTMQPQRGAVTNLASLRGDVLDRIEEAKKHMMIVMTTYASESDDAAAAEGMRALAELELASDALGSLIGRAATGAVAENGQVAP
jgi:sugar-specific transcriptional regulator TrmB